jgi:voltage-gated potassium channel Kch
LDIAADDITRPSIWWVMIAVVSPFLVLHRILGHERVTLETLFGALAAYLLIALAFSYLFLYLDRITTVPFFGAAESTTSYMYFSLVTITTLGFGDLVPVSDLPRYLTTVEAVVGQVLLVTVVARVVSVMSRGESAPDPEDVTSA